MQVQIERNKPFLECAKILITVGSVDFRLSVNNQGELIINKCEHGDGPDAITITPNVSNQIALK